MSETTPTIAKPGRRAGAPTAGLESAPVTTRPVLRGHRAYGLTISPRLERIRARPRVRLPEELEVEYLWRQAVISIIWGIAIAGLVFFAFLLMMAPR